MAYDPKATNVELEAKLTELRLVREGNEDFSTVDVQSTTLDDVTDEMRKYDALIAAVEAVVQANDSLLAQGWPELPAREVPPEVLDDLDAQIASMQAARAKYRSNAATKIVMTTGEPVDKKTKA